LDLVAVGNGYPRLFCINPVYCLCARIPRHANRRRCHVHRHGARNGNDFVLFSGHWFLCLLRQPCSRATHRQHRSKGGQMIMKVSQWLLLVSAFFGAVLFSATASAEIVVPERAYNISAIAMFVGFVLVTLGITYWAARRTKTAKDFYAAGGGITGFQNGLAIAGDFMSAASFLGIAGLVYLSGFDGLIYAIGFLVGWPIVLLLIAEPLRNLGRYTFADVASFRLQQKPIRILAASGSLVTVIFYLIAQMVGAGKLIEVLFGLPY